MEQQVVNLAAMQEAISASIQQLFPTIGAKLDPEFTVKRLEKMARIELLSDDQPGWRFGGSLKVCRQRKNLPAWALVARAKGARLMMFDTCRQTHVDETVGRLMSDIADLTEFANSGIDGVSRPARKFLKSNGLTDQGERCNLLHKLTQRARRADIRGRMEETVAVPKQVLYGAFRFEAMASPSQIAKLGAMAGNCLNPKTGDGSFFFEYAHELLNRKADFWAIWLSEALVAVIQTNLESNTVAQIKAIANQPTPAFLTEALYQFASAQGLKDAGGPLAEVGVVGALLDRDREWPDEIVWVSKKAYRVWLDEIEVVIVGPHKHFVARADRKRVFGNPQRSRRPWRLSQERIVTIIAALLMSNSGGHPTVRAVAAKVLDLGCDERLLTV